MVNQFIQVLADIPELNVHRQTSLKVLPIAKPKPKLKQLEVPIFNYFPNQKRKPVLSYVNQTINFGFEGKKPRNLQLHKNEEFNYSFLMSFEKH